jgi:hypothetical protein
MKQLAGGKMYGKQLFSEDLEVRDVQIKNYGKMKSLGEV